jgi:hypothetical protein
LFHKPNCKQDALARFVAAAVLIAIVPKGIGPRLVELTELAEP